MRTRRRDRIHALRAALVASLLIAAAACGDDDAGDGDATTPAPSETATAAAEPAATNAGDAASAPGVVVEPDGISSFDDLLTVSPSGQLVYEVDDQLCVFETPGGSQEFCVATTDTELGGAVADDATWHPDGDRVAFTAGSDQVVVLDLDDRSLTPVGTAGVGGAATSPFVLDGDFGFVGADGGEQLALIDDDGVLVPDWALDPEAPDERPLVLSAGGERYTYSAAGDPIVLALLDDSLTLESAAAIETVGDILLAVKRAASNGTAAVHTVTSDWSVLTWHLVTDDGVTLLPFSGSDAAPAPDSPDAVGMSSEEPETLLRWDSAADSVEAVAGFGEPIDDVFWPTPETVFVRTGAQVHLVGL